MIDELDSGIYEYLLGECLEVMQDKAKGQLIFTSHNLRPLEILENDSLLYTTVNPENCYIKSSYIKNTQNTRLSYLRTIKLGGQKEKLYNETNIYEMELAMRTGKKAVLTNGFIKKSQKTPKAEKELAKKYKADYERNKKSQPEYSEKTCTGIRDAIKAGICSDANQK